MNFSLKAVVFIVLVTMLNVSSSSAWAQIKVQPLDNVANPTNQEADESASDGDSFEVDMDAIENATISDPLPLDPQQNREPEAYEQPIIENANQKTITKVRALDKITAHITELSLPQDQVVQFGTLRIVARTCKSRPPEEIPETFAFLEIDDLQRNNELVRVFTGWMLASSPALNALEHPVYDIWVMSCKIVGASAPSAKP